MSTRPSASLHCANRSGALSHQSTGTNHNKLGHGTVWKEQQQGSCVQPKHQHQKHTKHHLFVHIHLRSQSLWPQITVCPILPLNTWARLGRLHRIRASGETSTAELSETSWKAQRKGRLCKSRMSAIETGEASGSPFFLDGRRAVPRSPPVL